jgi:hypothetical protein
MNNNDETYLNVVEMEEETMKEAFEIQPNLQPEQSINVNEGGK